jgi:hypothetical protein
MRASTSPTAQAARLLATRAIPAAPATIAASPAGSERWCEWPRRPASLPPFRGVRQALLHIQALQARHA